MADIKVMKTRSGSTEELSLEINGTDYVNEGMINFKRKLLFKASDYK